MTKGELDEALFPLAALKGVVEHDDTSAYFGSTMALRVHVQNAVNRGWLAYEASSAGERKFPMPKEVATEAGKELYAASGLASLPRQYLSRAYMWDWSGVKL